MMGSAQNGATTIKNNRHLQISCRGRFSKKRFDYSGIRTDLAYNPEFDRDYSDEQLLKRQEKVRAELKMDRRITNIKTLVVLPIVLYVLYYLVGGYLSQMG